MRRYPAVVASAGTLATCGTATRGPGEPAASAQATGSWCEGCQRLSVPSARRRLRPGRSHRRGRAEGLRFGRWLTWFVYLFFILAVILLAIAFFLQLTNASEAASFTQWVYRATDRLLAPFRAIYPQVEGENGSVLDFSILFAIIMYGLFALGVHAIVNWIDRDIAVLRAEALAAETQAAQWPPAVPAEVPGPRPPA